MELYRALGLLIEAPTPQHHAVAQALGLPPVPDASTYATEVTFQRYPFASVYLGPEGMMGGEARSRITGFWIALGMEPPGEPDHLSALLSLLASIEEQRAAEPDEAQRALLGEARKVLVGEHLLPWLVPYLVSFQGSADEHFRAWAELLVGALRTLAAEQASTTTVAGVLEELDPLDDPRDEGVGSEFLRGLLAPGRSGVVILRSDLAGAAQDLGLALRAGGAELRPLRPLRPGPPGHLGVARGLRRGLAWTRARHVG